MTATIAAEMGEVASGSIHYHTLFFIGMVLFIDFADCQRHRFEHGLPAEKTRRKGAF
jgi:hypothetical protein